MGKKFRRIKKQILPYFDMLFYCGGVLSPLVTTPQIIKIFYFENADGVSLISWLSYSFGAMFLLAYGIIHNQKPIIFLSICSLPFYLAVCVGVLLYGDIAL